MQHVTQNHKLFTHVHTWTAGSPVVWQTDSPEVLLYTPLECFTSTTIDDSWHFDCHLFNTQRQGGFASITEGYPDIGVAIRGGWLGPRTPNPEIKFLSGTEYDNNVHLHCYADSTVQFPQQNRQQWQMSCSKTSLNHTGPAELKTYSTGQVIA